MKWDIVGVCEARRPEERARIILKPGHLDGVAILINKRLRDQVIKMSLISVIYVILRLSKRYGLQIIQMYVPTNSSDDTEVEKLYENITTADEAENTYYYRE